MFYLLYTITYNKGVSKTLQAYVNKGYAKFGGSTHIHTNYRTEFENQLFTNIAEQLGIGYKMYMPLFDPQSNDRIEDFQHFLK